MSRQHSQDLLHVKEFVYSILHRKWSIECSFKLVQVIYMYRHSLISKSRDFAHQLGTLSNIMDMSTHIHNPKNMDPFEHVGSLGFIYGPL